MHELRYFLRYRRKDVNIAHISLMSGLYLKKMLETHNFKVMGYYSPYFYDISKIIFGKSIIVPRKYNLLLSPVLTIAAEKGLKHEK